MKFFLLVAVCGLVGFAHAGVGILSPAEEAEVYALFNKICESDRKSEGGNDGGAQVWCKYSNLEQRIEEVNHHVEIPAPVIPDTVVFIAPKDVSYEHNVVVSRAPGAGPKTKIFVIPSRASHASDAEYNAAPVAPVKPTVHFLRPKEGQ